MSAARDDSDSGEPGEGLHELEGGGPSSRVWVEAGVDQRAERRGDSPPSTYGVGAALKLGVAALAAEDGKGRGADQGLEMQRKALASPQPLWALWRYSSNPSGVALTMEFMAMSRHRPALRKLLADYSERFRRDQAEAIEVLLDRYGVAHEDFPPVVASVLTTSLSRVVVMEESLGFTLGHAETIERVERWLTAVEGEWGSPKR